VARGRTALDMLERDLAGRTWIVGDRPSIADLALFAYAHVAPAPDLDPWPAVRAWIGRIEALPGFVDDYVPYPANAQAGAGRSIYDGGN
jgi:glutathione S-transferase